MFILPAVQSISSIALTSSVNVSAAEARSEVSPSSSKSIRALTVSPARPRSRIRLSAPLSRRFPVMVPPERSRSPRFAESSTPIEMFAASLVSRIRSSPAVVST
jgi:hypothetical protein